MIVTGLPLLSEGVAHALGLQQWIKDSMQQWIVKYYDDGVYS